MARVAGGYIANLIYPDHFHRENPPDGSRFAMAAIGQRMSRVERSLPYLDLDMVARRQIAP